MGDGRAELDGGLVLMLATVLMGCLAYARLVTGDERERYGWLLAPLRRSFALRWSFATASRAISGLRRNSARSCVS